MYSLATVQVIALRRSQELLLNQSTSCHQQGRAGGYVGPSNKTSGS